MKLLTFASTATRFIAAQNLSLSAISPTSRRIAAAVLLLLLAAGYSHAATFTVNSLADSAPNGCTADAGGCTLREAINAANSDDDADVINFDSALNGAIQLERGQLVIEDSVTINGLGARRLSVVGDDNDRVFLIATPLLGESITVNISGLKITGGEATAVGNLLGEGGGILNGALLMVPMVTGTSTLNLSEVAIVDNEAATLGGGVATRLNAVTNIERSLISNNVSNAILPDGVLSDVGGGGVSNVAGETNIVNTTIDGNKSLAAGGGILNAAGDVNLTNVTISDNDSTAFGGGVVSTVGVIQQILGVTTLRNSIIAENSAVVGTDILTSDLLGTPGAFDSLGNNLVGSNFMVEAMFEASAMINGSPMPNAEADWVGSVQAGNQIMVPQLGSLRNNGGPTDTRAISATSPALNRANNCVVDNSCTDNPQGGNPPMMLVTDQRGTVFTRLVDGTVDIGAFERRLATSAEVSLGGRIADAGGRALARTTVSATNSAGVTKTTQTNAFGYYKFAALASGEVYVVEVRHKQFEFAPQVMYLTQNMSDFDFVAGAAQVTDKSVEVIQEPVRAVRAPRGK